MAFTVAIAQPTGVGSAVGTKGLSGAWLEEPVVITMPADQHAYEVTIEDQSTDVGAELDGAATAAPTLRAAGKGSVRLKIAYRATSVARWETGYRVVRFQRDADGTNLETVAPALLESPAETAEARGYAEIMDQVVRSARTNAPYAVRPLLVSASVDPSDLYTLVVVWDRAVVHGSFEGLSPAVVDVDSAGEGTTTSTYTLESPINPASAGSFTVSGINGVRSTIGAPAAGDSVAITVGIDRDADYWELIGQSNFAADPLHGGPALGYGEDQAYITADTRAWDHIAGAWIQAKSGGAYVRANIVDNTGTGTGPALGLVGARLAYRMATKLGAPVRMIAHTRTGQGIEYFSPASATLAYLGEGSAQHATLNHYNFVASLWAAAGVSPKIIAINVGEANSGDSQATHYAKLVTLINAKHALHPLASILLFQTVWPSDLPGAGDVSGVRAAQAQIASERAYVTLIDCSPLAVSQTTGVPSIEREIDYVHWSPDGYIRMADYAWNLYQGLAAPTVTPLDQAVSPVGIVTAVASYGENRSISGGNVTAWSDRIASKSLGGIGALKYPEHVAYVAAANNRPAVRFDQANSETLIVGQLAASGAAWTIFVVLFPSAVATANQQPVSLYDSTVSGGRIGLQLNFLGTMALHGVGGSDYSFAYAATNTLQILALSYGTDVRLYKDGIKVGNTLTLAGTGGAQNLTTPDLCVGSFQNGAAFYAGDLFQVFVDNAEYTAGQHLAVANALKRKYGIA